MNVSFVQDSPLNTVIIDSSSGRPLYEVNTPWKFSGRTTSIQRVGTSPNHEKMLLAQVEWRTWGHSEITFMGSTMRVDDFLPKAGFMSSSRILRTNDGRLYTWEQTWVGKLKLVDPDTQAVIAESHAMKPGIFSKPRMMNVDISPQGIQNMDAIVASFIIMEEKRRQRQRTNTSTNAGIIGASGS